MVFRNSFDALSITLDDEEAQCKALRTFSSSPTSTAPSDVSTPPQHIKTKCQKCETLHSNPKPYAPLTKQPSATTGTRSNHSSMEIQPSPMATANGMVSNSYLQIYYGRNHHSSKVPTIPCFHPILANCLGVPPHSLHIFHIHLCNNPHIVSQHPCDTTHPASIWHMCKTPQ